MKKYIPSADLVRTVAILGTVSIHVIQSIYSRIDFVGGMTWWVSDFWNAFSRISIPLFVMLSGYLMLGKDESNPDRVGRIIKRLAIPLLFWFGFYSIWNGGYPRLSNLRIIPMFSDFFSGNVFHLYFLVIMIGLYLLIPVIQQYFLKPIYLLIFLSLGVLFTLASYTNPHPIFNNILIIWIPYLGYFLAGHYMRTLKLNLLSKRIIFLVFSLSMLTTSLLSFYSIPKIYAGNQFLYPNGVLSPYFDNYLSPNVLIMSLCAFALLISVKNIDETKLKLTRGIAKNALGIYIIHSVVIDFIDKPLHLANDFVSIPLLPYLTAKFVIVFLASYALVSLVRRLRITRWMIGEK